MLYCEFLGKACMMYAERSYVPDSSCWCIYSTWKEEIYRSTKRMAGVGGRQGAYEPRGAEVARRFKHQIDSMSLSHAKFNNLSGCNDQSCRIHAEHPDPDKRCHITEIS
jgi:hypothetical protein